MLYFLISMLIMLWLLDRAVRIGRQDGVLLDTRFKLFELRDALRAAGIKHEIPQNSLFEYLDTTITKFIDLLPRFTVCETLILYLAHRNDPPVARARQKLEAALTAGENRRLARFYAALATILLEFLFRRHLITSSVGMHIARSWKRVSAIADRVSAKLVKTLTASPETSTLMEYAYAPPAGPTPIPEVHPVQMVG